MQNAVYLKALTNWNENAQTIQKQQKMEIERIDWFIEQMQMRVAFGWLREH